MNGQDLYHMRLELKTNGLIPDDKVQAFRQEISSISPNEGFIVDVSARIENGSSVIVLDFHHADPDAIDIGAECIRREFAGLNLKEELR